MATFQLEGRVLPLQIPLTMPTVVSHWEDQSGLTLDLTTTIIESAVKVLCEANRNLEADYPDINIYALDTVRSMVECVSFVTGIGFTVLLIEVLWPDGSIHPLTAENTHLSQYVTAFNLENASFREMLEILSKDNALIHAMHDLVSSITLPHGAAINCFRAIEGIRRTIAPGMSKSQGWKVLRESLNLDESYLTLVTKLSEGPRHADRSVVDHVDHRAKYQETIVRAWIVMNRFLEFRKRGNQPLPLTEFPLLT